MAFFLFIPLFYYIMAGVGVVLLSSGLTVSIGSVIMLTVCIGWTYRLTQVSLPRNWSGIFIINSTLHLGTQVLIMVALIFGFSWIETRCQAEQKAFLVFTGHLKSLCVENPEKGQCPKTEDELRAFNPKLYGKIERCAELEYTYIKSTEYFLWKAQFPSFVLFASPEHLPGLIREYPQEFGVVK